MKTYKIPRTDLIVSRIAYGCSMFGWDKLPTMANTAALGGFNLVDKASAGRLVNTAYDNGITLFDLADVYALGNTEAYFGEVLKQSPGLRNKIVIQSKCGQRLPDEPEPDCPARVDASRDHIVSSAESSLKRLGTDHLDIYLLHAPDALVEPEEVARAFDELNRAGKVRYFGVSNHTAAQIALLQKYIGQPLVVNQVHLGLGHPYMISGGMEFTLEVLEILKSLVAFTKGKALTHDRHHSFISLAEAGTLDYCRLHDIQIQAYSPLRGDLLKAPPGATPQIKQLAQVLAELAKKKDTTPSAIALAWLLRHPAGIVPIIGASNPEHVIDNCSADRVLLSREEWYILFSAAAEVQSRQAI